jgi:hypothetical protein
MSSHIPLTKVLLISLCVLALFKVEAVSGTPSPLRNKDLKKAEKIIEKLHRLANLTTAAPDCRTYRKMVAKLYPGLFIDISALRDSDLKTDLSTAAFLYEEVYYTWFTSGGSPINCTGQMRELYQRLCLTNQSHTRAQFLWAKARLHTGWAEAIIRFQSGDRDTETMSALSRIEVERAIDLKLAYRAVVILKGLEEKVISYSTLDEFEQQGAIAKISFETFFKDYMRATSIVDAILASLPRSVIYYQLQNARNSYHNGLFWWEKTYRRAEATISANSLAESDPLKTLRMQPRVVNYTVICNWRDGRKYIEKAETEIQRARNSN